jgi:hypothetical protein
MSLLVNQLPRQVAPTTVLVFAGTKRDREPDENQDTPPKRPSIGGGCGLLNPLTDSRCTVCKPAPQLAGKKPRQVSPVEKVTAEDEACDTITDKEEEDEEGSEGEGGQAEQEGIVTVKHFCVVVGR